MTVRIVLITTVASLVFVLGAPAEPGSEDRLAQLETQAHEQSERAAEQIQHLEEAARHLEAAGFESEAARAREHAVLLHTDLRNRLAEFEALQERRAGEERQRELQKLVEKAMEQLTEELRRELGTKLEARPKGPRPPEQAEENARAEAHRLMTLRNWERIREAARGELPRQPDAGDLEIAPEDLPTPPGLTIEPPRPPEIEARDEPDHSREAGVDHGAVLRQILQTLQRIERRLAE